MIQDVSTALNRNVRAVKWFQVSLYLIKTFQCVLEVWDPRRRLYVLQMTQAQGSGYLSLAALIPQRHCSLFYLFPTSARSHLSFILLPSPWFICWAGLTEDILEPWCWWNSHTDGIRGQRVSIYRREPVLSSLAPGTEAGFFTPALLLLFYLV